MDTENIFQDVETKYSEVMKPNETSVVKEENRFKVVEIEKYNEKIESAENNIKTASFITGVTALIFTTGATGLALAMNDGGLLRQIVLCMATLASLGLLGVSLKEMVESICKKVVLEQKLMDIEIHIDERIEEMLNNIQADAYRIMQEQIEGGKQR